MDFLTVLGEPKSSNYCRGRHFGVTLHPIVSPEFILRSVYCQSTLSFYPKKPHITIYGTSTYVATYGLKIREDMKKGHPSV